MGRLVRLPVRGERPGGDEGAVLHSRRDSAPHHPSSSIRAAGLTWPGGAEGGGGPRGAEPPEAPRGREPEAVREIIIIPLNHYHCSNEQHGLTESQKGSSTSR